MGRLNRQRRADKRRRRAAKQQTPRQRSPHDDHSFSLNARQLITIAVMAVRDEQVDGYVVALLALEAIDDRPGGGAEIELALASLLEGTMSAAWEDGWQPVELAHVARRAGGSAGAALVVAAIAGEARSYGGDRSAMPAEWRAQLDELGVVLPALGASYLAAAGHDAGLAWWDTVERAIKLIAQLWSLPAIPRLGPPPRSWGRRTDVRRPTAAPAGIDERILGRVRALLAKAESTEFPEEAEALTAKAQELMARYAIDHALLEGDAGGGAEPATRRMIIDDPYADEKSYLLAQVAAANRCQAVWLGDPPFSTVIGFPTDLDATELLFTSLLVQASTGLRLLGSAAPPGSRQRGTAFRRSFYVGFASRIGERLRAATAVAVDDAVRDHGDRLLPVLASRDDAVDEAMERIFPSRTQRRVGCSDGAGFSAGRAAAELAQLSHADELAPALF